MRRRGFTLIELLVVIAIIALLVGILLPAIASARGMAKNVVSQSNLKQLALTINYYATDLSDGFVNPFLAPGERWQWGNPPSFDCITVPPPQPPGPWFPMGDGTTNRKSEIFAAHWASLMGSYMGNGSASYDVSIQFSPQDVTVRQRFQSTPPPPPGNFYIWDGSYWYSPTFWMSPARYATEAVVTVTQQHIRRNRMSEVQFPQNKVMLWERFDWTRKTRLASGGTSRVNIQPGWNNPEARPNVTLCDGAVIRADMAKITDLANGTPEERAEFRPSGAWSGLAGYLQIYSMHEDGLESGPPASPAYPAFFWATRKGIKGRDLANF